MHSTSATRHAQLVNVRQLISKSTVLNGIFFLLPILIYQDKTCQRVRSVKIIAIIIMLGVAYYYHHLYYLSLCILGRLYWKLRDSKSLQYFSTVFNILFVFNNVIVWMFLTLPLFSNSLVFLMFFENVPSFPITTGTTVTLIILQHSRLSVKFNILIFLFSVFSNLLCDLPEERNIR